NGLLDLLFGYQIAVTDKHRELCIGRRRVLLAPPGWVSWPLLEDLVGRIETVGTFEGDGVELERRHGALDRSGLVDQAVDSRLHGGVALGVALADLLVVCLAA